MEQEPPSKIEPICAVDNTEQITKPDVDSVSSVSISDYISTGTLISSVSIVTGDNQQTGDA